MGLSIAVASWVLVAAYEDTLTQSAFDNDAQDHAQALQAGLDGYILRLLALRSLYDVSGDRVSRAEFKLFANELMAMGRDVRLAPIPLDVDQSFDVTGIFSFSWVPRVSREARARHEREGLAQGLEDYVIKSVATGRMTVAPEADEYFPIFFSSSATMTGALGIDLKDGGLRQAALDRARDGDMAAASANFTLQTGVGDRNGFFVVMPVYRPGMAHTTVPERRAALTGFVQGAFQIQAMVDAVLADLKSPLTFALFDVAAPGAPPVYIRAGTTSEGSTEATAGSGSTEPTAGSGNTEATFRSVADGAGWAGKVLVADRTWTLVVAPAVPAFTLVRHSRAWIVAASILLLTAALTALLFSVMRNLRALRIASEKVSILARTDGLTGLLNRRAFGDRLAEAFGGVPPGDRFGVPLGSSFGVPPGGRFGVPSGDSFGGVPSGYSFGAGPPGRSFAVQLIDLDDFKDINDAYGHAVGDAVLVHVARRLTESIRTGDCVARLGGDEFVILQTNVRDRAAAAELATRLLEAIRGPFVVDGLTLQMSLSIGIALDCEGAAGADAMMAQADLALYRAKAEGRDCFQFYTGALDQQMRLRINLADDLRAAINTDGLELHYQPQVEMRSGRIVGLEALLRWTHPTNGPIGPNIFIPIAEQTGVIRALGEWVLARACRQVRAWEDEGVVVPRLAVNVSGAQLRKPREFERSVGEILAASGVRGEQIELEIAESVLTASTERDAETIGRLRRLGVRIAIDDFGTGYSSLTYLATSPVTRLKLAQELIAGVPADPHKSVVIRSAVGLATDLGVECIAEGVETAEQVQFLLQAGCEMAQGYYYSLPVPAVAIPALIAASAFPAAIPAAASSAA